MTGPSCGLMHLLATLAERCVHLSVDGTDLLFRPRSGITADLAPWVMAYKPELLQVLTPGVEYTPRELFLLARSGVAPSILTVVGRVKRSFPDARAVAVEPRARDAGPIRGPEVAR